MQPLFYGNRSLAAFGVLLLAVQMFHPSVLIAVHHGQTAAWLATLIAAALTALAVWPVAVALRRMPGGSLWEVVRLAVGRWGAMGYALLLGATLLFQGAMILRETSEMALSANFPHTPQTFATTALLIGAVYMAMGSADSLVRLGPVFLPLVLLATLGALVGTLGWGEFRFLLPLLGPGPVRLLAGAPAVAASYGPLVLMLILAGQVADRRRLVGWFLAVPALTGVIYALVKANLVMTFAYPIGEAITFPLHAASRLIIGGRFFERLEGFWLMTWVMGTIVVLGALLYGTAWIFAHWPPPAWPS